MTRRKQSAADDARRAELFTLLHVLRVPGVRMSDALVDSGYEYDILTRPVRGPVRPSFGLFTQGQRETATEAEAKAALATAFARHDGREYGLPVLASYVNCVAETGWLAWLVEPVEGDDGEPQLVRHRRPRLMPLTDETTRECVRAVRAFYKAGAQAPA